MPTITIPAATLIQETGYSEALLSSLTHLTNSEDITAVSPGIVGTQRDEYGYTVQRLKLTFLTSALPSGATVTDAVLSFTSDYSQIDPDGIVVTDSYPFDQVTAGISAGDITVAAFTENGGVFTVSVAPDALVTDHSITYTLLSVSDSAATPLTTGMWDGLCWLSQDTQASLTITYVVIIPQHEESYPPAFSAEDLTAMLPAWLYGNTSPQDSNYVKVLSNVIPTATTAIEHIKLAAGRGALAGDALIDARLAWSCPATNLTNPTPNVSIATPATVHDSVPSGRSIRLNTYNNWSDQPDNNDTPSDTSDDMSRIQADNYLSSRDEIVMTEFFGITPAEIKAKNPAAHVYRCYSLLTKAPWESDYADPHTNTSILQYPIPRAEINAHDWWLRDSSNTILNTEDCPIVDVGKDGVREAYLANVLSRNEDLGFDGFVFDYWVPDIEWILRTFDNQPMPVNYSSNAEWFAKWQIFIGHIISGLRAAGYVCIGNCAGEYLDTSPEYLWQRQQLDGVVYEQLAVDWPQPDGYGGSIGGEWLTGDLVERRITAYNTDPLIALATDYGVRKEDPAPLYKQKLMASVAMYYIAIPQSQSKRSYNFYGNSRIQWEPIFDFNIGTPLSAIGIKVPGKYAWSREFTDGLVLFNYEPSGTATFSLSGYYRDVDGTTYSGSITLAPHTGLVLQVPYAEAPVSIRMATGQFDFLTARDAVFAISDDTTTYFRNIATRQVTASVDATLTYSLSGDPFVEDCPVLAKSTNGEWTTIPSYNIDPASHTIAFPATGNYALRYTSYALVDAINHDCVTIDSLPPKTPRRTSLWNSFDEMAMLAGIARLPDETNVSLKSRIGTAFCLGGNTSSEFVVAAIGHNMGLAGTIDWAGKSSINLTTLGLTGVTDVVVKEIPETAIVTVERLAGNLDRTIFASSHHEWNPGYIVYVGGVSTTHATYPGMDVTGGVVTFSKRQAKPVEVTYSYSNYTVTKDGGDYVVSLTPTTNLAEGNYTIVYVRGTRAFNADDTSYKDRSLLNEDGSATQEFLQLASSIRSDIPITAGIAEWGRVAHWFDEGEATPRFANIPILFK